MHPTKPAPKVKDLTASGLHAPSVVVWQPNTPTTRKILNNIN